MIGSVAKRDNRHNSRIFFKGGRGLDRRTTKWADTDADRMKEGRRVPLTYTRLAWHAVSLVPDRRERSLTVHATSISC